MVSINVGFEQQRAAPQRRVICLCPRNSSLPIITSTNQCQYPIPAFMSANEAKFLRCLQLDNKTSLGLEILEETQHVGVVFHRSADGIVTGLGRLKRSKKSTISKHQPDQTETRERTTCGRCGTKWMTTFMLLRFVSYTRARARRSVDESLNQLVIVGDVVVPYWPGASRSSLSRE